MPLPSDSTDDARARDRRLRCPRCLRSVPRSQIADGIAFCAACGALSCANLDAAMAMLTSSSSTAVARSGDPEVAYRSSGLDGGESGSPYRRTDGGPGTLRVSWRSGKHSWQRVALVIAALMFGGGLTMLGSPVVGLIWCATVVLGGFRPSRAFVELHGSSGRIVRAGARVEIVQGRRCCLTRSLIQTADGSELEEYTLHVIEQDGANKSIVIDIDGDRSLAIMRAVDAALTLRRSDP